MSSIDDLARRIERLEAAQEIQNVMGRYQYLHSAYMNAEMVDLFADRDDLAIEFPTGGFYGRDAARRLFGTFFDKELVPRDRGGELVEHLLTTPVIEVAGDAQTAKAVWNSPGHEVHQFFWVEGEPHIEFWYWCKYQVDFIKTDEGWKIWHLNVYQTWASEVNSSLVSSDAPPEPPVPPSGPSAPDTPLKVETRYSRNRSPQLIPAPPEPYDTFETAD